MSEMANHKRVDIVKHPEYYGTLSENNEGDWVIVPLETAERHDRESAAKDAVVNAAIELCDDWCGGCEGVTDGICFADCAAHAHRQAIVKLKATHPDGAGD